MIKLDYKDLQVDMEILISDENLDNLSKTPIKGVINRIINPHHIVVVSREGDFEIITNFCVNPFCDECENHTRFYREYNPLLDGKIIITGTGRSGTTFLTALLTILGFDTGFQEKDIDSIDKKTKGGLEIKSDTPQILKDPRYCLSLKDFVKSHDIGLIIIPLRDIEEASKSRYENGYVNGGLWNAIDYEQQILFHRKALSQLFITIATNDLDHILLDFNRMTNHYTYLYDKLKPLLDTKDINAQDFATAFHKATQYCKR